MEKAQNAIAALPSRRNFVKSSVALALAGLAPVAMSKVSGAAAFFNDSEFAITRSKYRELKTALDNLYEANYIKLKRLECPELPGALLEPLEIPGFGKRPPDETKHGRSLEGWSASELERLATQGKWEVFIRTDKAGTITVKSGFRAVPQATKKRATELLPMRVAYDAAVKKWWSKVHRIENSTGRPMKKMDNALLEAMEHRVAHIGELFQKVQLAKEAGLFADHSLPGDMETQTLECLFRDIQKLAMQA